MPSKRKNSLAILSLTVGLLPLPAIGQEADEQGGDEDNFIEEVLVTGSRVIRSSATADAEEVRNVFSVDVFEEKNIVLKMMFDPDHSLEQRILDEQFL